MWHKKLAAMQEYELQYGYCVALKKESGKASRRNNMERWVVAAKRADFAAIRKKVRILSGDRQTDPEPGCTGQG